MSVFSGLCYGWSIQYAGMATHAACSRTGVPMTRVITCRGAPAEVGLASADEGDPIAWQRQPSTALSMNGVMPRRADQLRRWEVFGTAIDNLHCIINEPQSYPGADGTFDELLRSDLKLREIVPPIDDATW